MYLQSKDKKNGTSTKEHVGNLLMISTLFSQAAPSFPMTSARIAL
jgi:hypothetical protein